MKNRFKHLKLTLLVPSIALLFSACSVSPTVGTGAVYHPNAEVPFIKVLSDVDTTTVHFYGAGSHRIYNNNYRYAFAIAAKSARALGYEYFTLRANKELTKQYLARGVKNAREAIDACTEAGEGAYSTVSFFGNSELCNSIVHTYSENTLSGTVRHAEIMIFPELIHGGEDYDATFSVEDVLAQEDVQTVIKAFPKDIDNIVSYFEKQ